MTRHQFSHIWLRDLLLGFVCLLMGLSSQAQTPLHDLSRQMDAQVGRVGLIGMGLETLNVSFLQWVEDSTLPVTVPMGLPEHRPVRSIDWPGVPTLVRQDLSQKWQHYSRVASNLESTYELLISHVAQGLYTTDRGAYLMGSLRRVLVMVEDLRTLQGEMYYLMRQGFRRSLPPASNGLTRMATLTLDSTLLLARTTLTTMRFGPYSQVPILADSLAEQIRRARILQPQLRKPPYVNQADSRSGYQQYAWIIKQALKIEEAARTYRKNMSVPLPYRRFGPQYYTYNHLLNLPFSAEGEGLVASFNRWCALTDPAFLPHARAYPWIMPIDPPVEQAPVPTSLEGSQAQNLVFLIDISASMQARLPRFQQAFSDMSGELREEDRIAFVSFAADAREVLAPTPGDQQQVLLRALRSMESKGKTAILPGFEAAYAAALPSVSTETNSRVILVTDGEFSITSELLQLISDSFRKGVSLTILFLGERTQSMQLRMSRLSSAGGGHLHLLSARSAQESLVQAVLTPSQQP